MAPSLATSTPTHSCHFFGTPPFVLCGFPAFTSLLINKIGTKSKPLVKKTCRNVIDNELIWRTHCQGSHVFWKTWHLKRYVEVNGSEIEISWLIIKYFWQCSRVELLTNGQLVSQFENNMEERSCKKVKGNWPNFVKVLAFGNVVLVRFICHYWF